MARVNELMAKLVAYNIGVVVHEAFEHCVDTGVPVPDLQMPIAGQRWRPSWDKIALAWDKTPQEGPSESDPDGGSPSEEGS